MPTTEHAVSCVNSGKPTVVTRGARDRKFRVLKDAQEQVWGRRLNGKKKLGLRQKRSVSEHLQKRGWTGMKQRDPIITTSRVRKGA